VTLAGSLAPPERELPRASPPPTHPLPTPSPGATKLWPSYNNVALIYKAQGKYEEALETHTKSLDIKTRILGGDSHLDVAKSYNCICNVCHSQGQYEQALQYYQKSLDTKIRICGQDFPSVASSYTNVAAVVYDHSSQGNRQKRWLVGHTA
jgi:tetratricopeptide (TPR) repeat protein